MPKCISCNQNLHGDYCHNCGEKIVQPEDFSIKKIIGNAFSAIFNIDSSFYKSIKYLLFKPGFLTKEFIRGRRKPYMKPFQMYIGGIILFYIVFSSMDFFFIPSQWFFNSDYPEMENAKILSQSIAEKWNLTNEELTILYDGRVGANSKLFIFLLLPIIAFGSLLIGFSKHKEYGIHLVHAVHLFTFLLVTFLLLFLILSILPGNHSGIYFLVPIAIFLSIYFTISIKRIFEYGLIRSFLSSIVVVVIVLLSTWQFRYGVSYLTLKSLEYPFFMDGF